MVKVFTHFTRSRKVCYITRKILIFLCFQQFVKASVYQITKTMIIILRACITRVNISIIIDAYKAITMTGKRTNILWMTNNSAKKLFKLPNLKTNFLSKKEIEDFLSNHGEKQLARNTDLLTQYDKRGSLVGLNSSDKDLILHGNKNQIKL